MEAGHQVHLANPAAIEQYNDIKYTNYFTEGPTGDTHGLTPLKTAHASPNGSESP